LGNLEGPLSNAIPITLDRPCYRDFFENISIFVKEDNLVDDLTSVFKNFKNYQKSDWPRYKREILEKFNWRDTTAPFWNRIMDSLDGA
jgi:hypothetical protein